METALKINPSLCVLSPPAWAQPFTVRGKAFMHQARHISLFLYNRINLKCLQSDLWNARSLWRSLVQFWYTSKSCKMQKSGPWHLCKNKKNKNSWYATKGSRVQKLGPWLSFSGGCSVG